MIDAHQHFWSLDEPFDYEWLKTEAHAPICRDYGPSDLKPHLDACGIQGSVVVQTQHDLAENRWALDLADRFEFLLGVVGWVDLEAESMADDLAAFAEHPKAVGIRHITQDEPDDDFIIRPDVLRGLKELERTGMPFDLLFFPRHLKHATTLARQLPSLPMVIDHLAKPNIASRELGNWETELRAAAKFPNLFCKLSGLVTEATWNGWTAADLRRPVEVAIKAFGPERCLFGSDWPVCELASNYERWFGTLDGLTAALSETERTQLFEETAVRFYQLSDSQ